MSDKFIIHINHKKYGSSYSIYGRARATAVKLTEKHYEIYLYLKRANQELVLVQIWQNDVRRYQIMR